ncbi:hypothetical protein ATK36_0790 [Amycolatopsis sulphurea]|uniref:Uncharacterized protein n=1 Tax=Amycolatopsis sulphurea TaxID=76022 RepID=A0A2A9G3A4_9PSEU|nr:hypothetical protein ATK36_0790 [Amycolatopsis sulphurea]
MKDDRPFRTYSADSSGPKVTTCAVTIPESAGDLRPYPRIMRCRTIGSRGKGTS